MAEPDSEPPIAPRPVVVGPAMLQRLAHPSKSRWQIYRVTVAGRT